MIAAGSDEEIELLITRIREIIGNNYNILKEVALNSVMLIGVRAIAFRLFIFLTFSKKSTPFKVRIVCESLAMHEDAMVREGVVLGLGDAGCIDKIKNFLCDEDEIVVEQAKALLEDLV